MRRAYIRLTRSGPSLKEQEDALRQAGIDDFSDSGPIHVEPMPKAGAAADARRVAAIQSLDAGDELVIATPGCLGGTRADILATLTAISERGAALHVASTGVTIKWSEEAARAAEFVAQAESEGAAMRARNARLARSAGKLGGRKPRLVKGTAAFEEAEQAWRDPTKSAADVARETGLSAPTLYRAFGAKGTPLFGGNVGRKPAKTNSSKG